MNLEESNSYNEEIESRDRKRRAVMLSIILCGVFIALLFILIIILSYQDSITEKFFIDGVQVKTLNNTLYKDIGGVTYIDVNKFSRVLGYTYTKGEYQKYNEDENSCYLQNNFEIVTLTAGNKSYNKYIELSGNNTIAGITVTAKHNKDQAENYILSNSIVFEDGIIYVPLDSLSKMFNVRISWDEYRKKIYTLENIVASAKNTITSRKYTEMSGYYENIRAILDGYVVVSKSQGNPKYYGVFSLNDNIETISLKYDEMTYIQNVGEFYIKVENGTMGLLNTSGGTIIAPSEFEDISLLDDDGENQLYLVKKGQEYGVVNRKGDILVFAENDKVGLEPSEIRDFASDNIRNPSVLYDACIPVKKDGKYGLFNKSGDQVLNISYEGFGYKSTASKTSGNEQSVLLIPPSVGIKGIVVNYDDMYGIYDVTTEGLILPCVYSKIYTITKNGKTTYYIEYNGASIELKDFLEDNGLTNVDAEGNPLKSKTKNKSIDDDVPTNGNVISSDEENNISNDESNVIELN